MKTKPTMTRQELDRMSEACELLEKELHDPRYQANNKVYDITDLLDYDGIDPAVARAIKLSCQMAIKAGTGAAHHAATQVCQFFLLSLQAEGHDPVEYVKRGLGRFKQFYKDPGPDADN